MKDNQKNVIAVPPAPEISESPAPVVGLSHGDQSFRPLHDQSSLRRLEVPQSISGSRRALQAARITSNRCSDVLAPCRSNSSNTIGLIKPSCNSCWLVCDKPNAVMTFIVTVANHSPFILRTTPAVVNGPSHANLQG